MQRPRALLLSPVWPDAGGSGPAQRAQQWVHLLARQFDVDVLVVRSRAEPVEGQSCRPPGAAQCRELVPTPTRASYWSRALGALVAAGVGRRPFAWVGWGREWAFLTAGARARLHEWYGGQQWQRVVVFRLRLFDYARHLLEQGAVSAGDVVLDFDDIESATRLSIAAGLSRMGRWREAMLTRLDGLHARRVERRVVECFPRVAVCSPADRSWVEHHLPRTQVEVVPNRIARLPPRMGNAPLHRILFLGTLGYFPNEEAARFLVSKVLPMLRGEDERWRVVIAGYLAPVALRQWLERQPGVEMRGPVERVEEAYAGAGLVAAPLFCGGGTKVKVIEALGHGRTLIATQHAVRGLALRPTRDFWPAENAVEWLAACRRLVREPELAARLGESGREAVRDNYVYGEGAL